jgi:hypothetical protein
MSDIAGNPRIVAESGDRIVVERGIKVKAYAILRKDEPLSSAKWGSKGVLSQAMARSDFKLVIPAKPYEPPTK